MRAPALVPVFLGIAGVAFIADAVVRGAAGVALVVIFPVVYGGDAEFLLGVVLLLGAFLTLPFALGGSIDWDPDVGPGSVDRADGGSRGETMGLVLIGPVPLFFGAWKTVSWKVKATVVALGALLLVGAVLVVVWR
jgi:uncharacterized membrane protein